ncbi:MAG: CDP-alcohol phosphatidyltransferase family protein [Candidatus Undinarchaeales archaeon]|nr:CDP-alcohol phosphatidyltransferase family protein [Candidatus Undinarchaeales archaeon]MDP7494418.1 CDP-alcohol phosphatidyltransferase family protein [Candidatus Undinarchaeales archaeon]
MADLAVRLMGAPGGGEELRVSFFDPYLTPVCRVLARLGVTPNTVTLLSLLVTAAAVHVLVSRGELDLAMALVVLSWVLDGFDGSLARLTGTTSKSGALLDRLVDRVTVFALFAALAATNRVEPILALTALFLFMLIDYVRLRLKLDWDIDTVEATGGRAVVLLGWVLGRFDLAFYAIIIIYVALLVLQANTLRKELAA